jgi:transcriptional/translational regulatory protein YebC/TACO1
MDAQYEGIKGGTAVVVNVLTDNKNRAAAEVGNVFKKNGLEFAKQASATRLFDRMGQIMIPAADGVTEDGVMEVALEAGAEDVVSEDGGFTVKCQPNDFTAVLEAVKNAGIAVDEENSSVGLVPNMTSPVSDVATAKAVQKFIDMLEDLEDVQDVFHNMETTDEVDAALAAEG